MGRIYSMHVSNETQILNLGYKNTKEKKPMGD